MNDPIQQFADRIRAAGLTPPDVVEPGTFHRFPGVGKRNGNTAGWCKLFADGMGGSFGDFSQNFAADWQAKRERPLTLAERKHFRQQVEKARAEAEAEKARRYLEARELATKRYDAASPADPTHPYLARKGVKPHGIRQEGNQLLIPMRDAGNALHSLQTIGPDGDKRFLTGGRVTGCYHALGKPGVTVCIVEGYATGASVHEATGYSVAVAFNAGNLEAVARALRARMPDARIILCADDDAATPGNPGVTKATEAALAIGGLLALPEFGDDRPEGATDFNDIARHVGAEAVRRAVERAAPPDVLEAPPSAPDAPAGDSGLRVLNLGELLTHAFPEREEILAPWLHTQSLNLVTAWRGVGKTHFAAGVAYAVATGGGFLNWQAPRPRRVLYLDGEMPGPAIQTRFRALVEADERDFDTGNLLTLTPDAQEGPLPDLASTDGQEAVAALAERHAVDLIIVDNISTLCRSGGAENEAESWRGPQEWALRMRRAGRSVLFVHHEGKNGSQRGSSKREDTLDVSIKLKHPPDYCPEEGARFEIHFDKYRGKPGDDVSPIEARLETDSNGRTVWTCRSVEAGTYERVIALHNEAFKPGEIAAELGINKSNVSRHLKRARSDGLLKGAA